VEVNVNLARCINFLKGCGFVSYTIGKLDTYDVIELSFEGVIEAEELLETRMRMRAMFEKHGEMSSLVDIRDMEFGMSTSQIYEFASTIKNPVGLRIAMVARPDDANARFFENVAHNKGVPLRLFTDYDQALAFLTE
jgi:hypothetical protein